MASKTVHVYFSDAAWHVKKEGQAGKAYATRREAVIAARKRVQRSASGQVVVYGKDGGIKNYWVHNMIRIQGPRKRSSRAADISRAVGRTAIERVKADKISEQATKK